MSKDQIYALHTKTRHRERIASLSIDPQCLGVGHGWICVGGPDQGQCAFVNIGDRFLSGGGVLPTTRQSTEVDALLPLDLDPHSRTLAQNFLAYSDDGSRLPWQPTKVDYHELGGSIVNSITVHKVRSGKEGLQDEVVAVIG